MIRGAFDKLRRGLSKTSSSLFGRLDDLLRGKISLDADTLEQIEEMLISADLGVKASTRITRNIERRLRQEHGEATREGVLKVIRGDIARILAEAEPKVRRLSWDEAGDAPAAGGKKKKRKKGKGGAEAAAEPQAAEPADAGVHVVFVVGVNGTGKTTSIAKLALHYKNEGKSVLLAAADTFRAAAVEQLGIWADRIGVSWVQQGQGADPAAVVFDALSAAESRGHDIVIVDTAGRLHTKTNLMDELAKMARVIRRKTGRDPETLLVVDANTGQNGLQQARSFAETVPVDGLVLTKLDGTAKGGIVVAIAETLGLPVRYIGVGEQAEDLAVFDPESFVEALFSDRGGAAAE